MLIIRSLIPVVAFGIVGGSGQAGPGELPVWLQVNQPTLEMMWDRGTADSGRGNKVLVDRTRRSIGQIDARPLREEAESFVWVVDPYVQAYQLGAKARSSGWPADQIKQTHDALTTWAAGGRKKATFQIVLNVLRVNPPGLLTHVKAPDVFKDIRVEMKVAGRRYAPVREPDELTHLAGTGSITSTGFHEVVAPLVGVPVGPGEISTGGAAVTDFFTDYRTEKYEFFQGNFTVVFDLFDPDGTPRVRPKDVGISLIVITNGNEREAKYGWADLMDLRIEGKK